MREGPERIAVLSRPIDGMRVIHSIRERDRRLGTSTATIALYAPSERASMFVREADQAFEVPPVGIRAPVGQGAADGGALADILEAAAADSLWVGWSAPDLVDAAATCDRAGLILLSPDVHSLRLERDGQALADAARSLAIRHGSDEHRSGERRIVVPYVADWFGVVRTFRPLDCTLRRPSGVVLRESPSPAFEEPFERHLEELAGSLCGKLALRGVGAVEFTCAAEGDEVALSSLTPGVLPCHALVEMACGLDLVGLQMDLALGAPLTADLAPCHGHAVGVDLCAEDPETFAPAPGVLGLFRLPTGPGLRIDRGYAEGDVVAAADGVTAPVASISAWAPDRVAALSRLERALSETALLVRSGATNKGFLTELLLRAEVQDGTADQGWLEDEMAAGRLVPHRLGEVALVQAALEAYHRAMVSDRSAFYASAARGRPSAVRGVGRTIELHHAGHPYAISVLQLDRGRYRLTLEGQSIEATVERVGTMERLLTCMGARHRVVAAEEENGYLVEVDGIAHRIAGEEGGVVVAPAPAVVVATHVKAGDMVSLGDPLLVLESMKMEMSIAATMPGRVRSIVDSNTQVASGTTLVRLVPDGPARPTPDGGRLRFRPDPAREPHDLGPVLDQLRRLVLGFDVEADEARGLGPAWGAACSVRAADDPEIMRGEEEVLAIVADVCSLIRPQTQSIDGDDEAARAPKEDFPIYLRALDARQDALSATFVDDLRRALAHYGIDGLERTPALEAAVFQMFRSQARVAEQVGPVLAILDRRLAHVDSLRATVGEGFRALLDRLAWVTTRRSPEVADMAREVRYRFFDQPMLQRVQDRDYEDVERHLGALERDGDRTPGAALERHLAELVESPQPIKGMLIRRLEGASRPLRRAILECLVRRYYRIRELRSVRAVEAEGVDAVTARYDYDGLSFHLIALPGRYGELVDAAKAAASLVGAADPGDEVLVDLYVRRDGALPSADATAAEIEAVLGEVRFPRPVRRIAVTMSGPGDELETPRGEHFTYRLTEEGYREDRTYRGLHPMMAKRLELWRLSNFQTERLPSVEDVYLFRGVARDNPKDERLFAIAEVRDMTPVTDDRGRVTGLPHLERMLTEALEGIRLHQSHRPPGRRLQWNRVLLSIRPPVDVPINELFGVVQKLAPMADGLGLEKVVARGRIPDPASGEYRDTVLHISNPVGRGLVLRFDRVADRPIQPLSDTMQKVVQMRQRGLIYPYEIVRMLAPTGDGTRADFPPGEFVEYDVDEEERLAPVDRPFGKNSSNMVVGVIRSFTEAYPEGMTRVILLGDPSRALGSLAGPECQRIVLGLDLAERMGVPLEWFAVSAGAKISMESGTENMDWIGRVLRRLIEFTQAGGEVNVIVCGINVGAQPYWNAEATMLMHTRGILVMTPDGAMVLTGKQALDYSGGVSAEDNYGIGGYDKVMGPNGQAQYWARDIDEACHILLRHYEHTYVAPGDRFPRRVPTTDPVDRDVRTYPHREDYTGFRTVGEVLSESSNPGRKRAFDVRSVMRAVIDQDRPPLERWPDLRDGEIAVVWDAHLGGIPVELLGIESRPLPRLGQVSADGPDYWTAGTLFPMSSKKVARSINAASGNRPVVILANLSGFDGSPESLRNLQLEYGAEIGRAVTNFDGPMVFCVISRYHGGAFVVFSATLNEQLEIAAVEGSYASVIGGAPAAAVVFTREVDGRTKADPRVKAQEEEVAGAEGPDKARARARLDAVTRAVRSDKQGEVASEFDHVHTIYRAKEVGSVDRIISAQELRAYLIDAVERGMARSLERQGAAPRAGTRQHPPRDE